ncbi:MAG: C39 family peptidase [Methanoregula sp.]
MKKKEVISHMKLFKPTVILLVLLLAAMIIVPMVSAEPDNTIPDKNFVSVEIATSVGNYYVEQISGSMQEYSDWKGATVQKATTYYDFNEKKSAYSFDVLVNGQYAGYLMISATRDNYPLLEFSKGKTPDREISNQVKVTELAAADAKSQQATLGAGRPLYLGATFFYMEYPVEKTSTVKSTSQQSQDKILVDLYEMRIIEPKTVSGSGNTAISAELTAAQNEVRAVLDQTSIQKFHQEKKLEAQAEWDAVDKVSVSSSTKTAEVRSVSASYIIEKIISGVPNFKWLHGCSPTSAAMVLGYWRDRGLTRLPDAQMPNGDPLNEDLALAMGTDASGSTWPWMIAYGINRVVAVDNGYHYTSGSAVVTAYSWPAIQSEIDSDRPFVLSMLWAGEPIYAFGHSVAAVGYGYDSWGSSKFIRIYTTWDDPSDTYIRFGNWVGAMNTYERPDYTYTITSSAGSHGTIYPAGSIQVPTGTEVVFTSTPDSGYIIDQILVDNSPVTQNPYTFSDVTSDHTITTTFKEDALPAIVPLCQAGDAFDATRYPQNWPQSDPMTVSCNWDGNGRVYLSGSSSELIGTHADDGFTVDTPNGIQFDAEGHYAHQHAPLELTSGMNTGSNTLTLIVRNYMGLSMSYGSSTGIGTDQTPYIIEVNDQSMIAAAQSSAAKAFTFVPNSTPLNESISTTTTQKIR